MYEERIQSEGVIYINDYKQVGSKQPEWTGTVTLNKQILQDLVSKMREQNADSVEMRIALWDRVSKKIKSLNLHVWMLLKKKNNNRNQSKSHHR